MCVWPAGCNSITYELLITHLCVRQVKNRIGILATWPCRLLAYWTMHPALASAQGCEQGGVRPPQQGRRTLTSNVHVCAPWRGSETTWHSWATSTSFLPATTLQTGQPAWHIWTPPSGNRGRRTGHPHIAPSGPGLGGPRIMPEAITATLHESCRFQVDKPSLILRLRAAQCKCKHVATRSAL